MNTEVLQIALSLFLCPVLYFFVKYIKAKRKAKVANNHEFSFMYFVQNDSLDIFIAFAITLVVYLTKDGHGILAVDLSNPSKAFATGMTICTVTVGIVLSMLGLGDGTERKNNEIVDYKTDIADKKT